jgi:hypothetical protein
MSKTFILAFNHEDVKNFTRKNPDVNPIILNRPEQLYGTINPHVIITQNAYRRPDFTEFKDIIKTRIYGTRQ